MPPRKSDASRKSDVAVRPAPKPAEHPQSKTNPVAETPTQPRPEPSTPATGEKKDKESKETKEGVSIDVRLLFLFFFLLLLCLPVIRNAQELEILKPNFRI